MPNTSHAESSTQKSVLTVSELNRQARVTIEQRFNQVWVMGEMSNFARPRSGHWYFSLKDDKAQVRCAMFANRNRSVAMQPGDGQLVIARGRVSLYEGRGDFQIIVDHLEPAGEGALRQAFDQLKVKLSAQGLFDEANKQPLPSFPHHVAVITSATGAAFKDVLAVWRRRMPSLRVTLIPTAVQGEAAEAQILAALGRAQALEPDMILLTRGGGSLEDLWSFNLESVARALAACPIPTVSAVGHEIDVTICDFVADLRAPTPSAAAELMVPSATEVARQLQDYARHLSQIWRRYHDYQKLRLANLRLKLASPEQVLEQANQRLDDNANRLARAMQHKLSYSRVHLHSQTRQLSSLGPKEQIQNARQQVHALEARIRYSTKQQIDVHRQSLSALSRMLTTVSPLPTLARGFAVVTTDDGTAVTSVSGLNEGQAIRTYLSDGAVLSQITGIDKDASIVKAPDE